MRERERAGNAPLSVSHMHLPRADGAVFHRARRLPPPFPAPAPSGLTIALSPSLYKLLYQASLLKAACFFQVLESIWNMPKRIPNHFVQVLESNTFNLELILKGARFDINLRM